MSTYVMADIHGQRGLFVKMLDMINFSNQDELYIIGDIIDRGSESLEIIKLIMKSTNIHYLVGNHEVMLIENAKFLLSEITDENINKLSEIDIIKLSDWLSNGGDKTLKELSQLSIDERKEIIEFISDCDLYDEISVAGKDYILVHSGLGNFDADKPLWDYTLDELVWTRPDFSQSYYDDKTIIIGHTPTQAIKVFDKKSYIYYGNGIIDIDCGCTYNGGQLACLRLDDMKEFYVENIV